MFPLFQQYFDRGYRVKEYYQPLPPDWNLNQIDSFAEEYKMEIVFNDSKPYALILRVSEDIWSNPDADFDLPKL